MSELLDIVDERDTVIGQAEREVAHAQGLKIRLVYVWFYTPGGEVILQRRGSTKKSHPDRLVSTMSGHVSAGDSYLEAAVRETGEETGVVVKPHDLQLFAKVQLRMEQPGYITDGFRSIYTYEFTGGIDELKIEPEEGAGFELWECSALLEALDTQPDNFAPFMMEPINRELIASIIQGSQAS